MEYRKWTIDETKLDIYIQNIENLKISNIILTWWEIFKDKKMIDITLKLINKLSKKKITVSINTNWTNLNQDIISKLKTYNNINNITVSLDSVISHENNFLRWETSNVISNINLLIKNWFSTSVLITLNKINLQTFMTTYKELEKLWVEQIFINPVFMQNTHTLYNKLSIDNLSNAQINEINKELLTIKKSQKFPQISRYFRFWTNYFKNKTKDPQAYCKMGKKFFVLEANWDLKRCFYSTKTLGNLLKDKLSTNSIISQWQQKLPKCFSKKCITLFAIDEFWEKNIEK